MLKDARTDRGGPRTPKSRAYSECVRTHLVSLPSESLRGPVWRVSSPTAAAE